MRRKNCGSTGAAAVIAFGAGLLLCCFLPAEWLVTILAIMLVLLGIVCLK